MKNFKSKVFAILKDESAQGMAEYALLLVVILAIAGIFRNQISKAVTDKMSKISSDLTNFSGTGN